MDTTTFNRRDFLKTTAAAAAILPTFNVLSQTKAETIGPDDDQLNVAVIGYGAEGEILTDAAMKIPGIRFTAVCDIWPYRQKLAKGRLKALGHQVNVYEDYREMLDKEDKNIDAVIVATPDWMHAEHTNYCLIEKGKHVYCEKEMSNRLEKAASMVLAQRETGKILQIGHQRRSNPRYMHAINRVIREANMLGRVTHAYGQWNRSVAPFIEERPVLHIPIDTLQKYGYENMEQFRNWRWFDKYGGGPMVDLGSHQIDLFFWVWDCQPISVTAIGGSDYYNRQMNDNVMAMYEFKTKEGKINRAYYQVLTTSSRGGFYEQFMGENGSLTISEIAARGNTAQREVRGGGPDESLWVEFAKQGLVVQPKKTVSREVSSNVAIDARVTAAADGWPLPVDLLKPAHMPHLENFFLAVRRNKPELLNCPADLAYESAVAVLAANRSVAEGKTIKFKPEEFHV
ncbi:MAG: Gfo/Idh/MocA family oxidoreductase [Verrucomicrobiota bacterium]|jgi:predicted dehydrogenase|nr:Gfo/Idh/MocA family oxidoreductase [Verrucomicrobiota bacterium]